MNGQLIGNFRKEFEKYKLLGEKTMAQVPEEMLFWKFNEESNSIGTIVKHLWGNMLSRWTDFLTSDGEKEWRERDEEFDNDIQSREILLVKWNEGWNCLFETLRSLNKVDLNRIVYIRREPHTVIEALLRQHSHYAYHIGQIVFIGKMILNEQWSSLSIPRKKC